VVSEVPDVINKNTYEDLFEFIIYEGCLQDNGEIVELYDECGITI
jgi:hypothetical protein